MNRRDSELLWMWVLLAWCVLLSMCSTGCVQHRKLLIDAQTPEGVRCAWECQQSVDCIKQCRGVYTVEVCE